MERATKDRRDDLRNTLTDIAERMVAETGAASVKARPLAEAAGCSVGAIYNVFTDLDALLMAVNGRTFRRLGAHVSAALQRVEASPQERLVIMGHAYLDFASQHTNAWRALFDLRMSTDMEVPGWYLQELAAVFALIAGPLRDIFPSWSDERIDLMTRALFSSVHGIVLLGLEKRISGVPLAQVEDMIATVLAQVTDR